MAFLSVVRPVWGSFDLRNGEDMVFLVSKYFGLQSTPPGEPGPFLNRKRMVAA